MLLKVASLAVPLDRQRIDKWLWHARMVRTRSAAAALAAAGHVRINGQRVDAPSRAVRPGDVVTVALDRAVRVLKVLGFAERRGSADDARALCEAIEPAPGRPWRGRSRRRRCARSAPAVRPSASGAPSDVSPARTRADVGRDDPSIRPSFAGRTATRFPASPGDFSSTDWQSNRCAPTLAWALPMRYSARASGELVDDLHRQRQLH